MIIHADILEWATSYEGEPFHALLCDPPYHLTEITKRFSSPDAAPAQYGTDGAFQRASKGFMGRDWDGGDIAFRPETWSALARHLYPGAFGMAFASTRGWHRMACAIEDAGLIIHPVVMCWTFLSGFPKATRIDTQIDKAAGVEREVTGQRAHAPKFAAKDFGYREKDNGYNSRERESFDVTAPATDLARAWEGHRYGLQALKPALEPVIVFQKPYQGRPVECIAATGAGALNIDAGRISGTVPSVPQPAFVAGNAFAPKERSGEMSQSEGRWPSNLTLVHHPSCNGTCHEQCPVRRLGEQSGVSKASDPRGSVSWSKGKGTTGHEGWQREAHASYEPTESHGYGDTGTAARMFLNASWMYERLEDADPAAYFPKASTAEREAGLEGFASVTVDDGRDTPVDNAYQRGEMQRRNSHPTLKPLSLVKYLATLLLPPIEYAPRRLLCPFAGSGSEVIGGLLAGFEQVVGIEKEEEYVTIARARLDWWTMAARRLATDDPETILAMRENADEGMTIFDLLDAA